MGVLTQNLNETFYLFGILGTFGSIVYLALRPAVLFPAGPVSVPILGNLLQFPLPAQHPWFKLTEWKKTFGEITYFHGMGKSIVVLNNLETSADILSKHGHIFAHRPVFTMVGELMGLDRSLSAMSATKMWQHHRRLAHMALSPESVRKYHGTQEDITALMILAMLNNPKRFIDHVRLAAGRIVMSVTYGISPQVAEEDYIAHAEDTMRLVSETMVPGAFLVDLFPALKHIPKRLPFKTFHDEAKIGRAMMDKMVDAPFVQVQDEMASESGPARPSFVSDLLSMSAEDNELDKTEFEETVKWVSGSMYGAGGESTFSTVLNCILAMALHPTSQQKVQAELDALLVDRLPNIADRQSTPYLNALIKEVMRWRPALPLGIPHRSSKGIVYKGHFIPEDTIAIPNIWAVSREPDAEFPPEDFIPERFLPRKSTTTLPDPSTYVFGFGRRICPGRHLAENSVYVMIASLVYCFFFGPPQDAGGTGTRPINPTWKSGLLSLVNPFECEIQPRTMEKATLIRQRASLCNED
ncbi:cytochrome P450 [Mycena floridula]|nr:cytochrome P450 [Mycena floridula]